VAIECESMWSFRQNASLLPRPSHNRVIAIVGGVIQL
jgi:hypothetical protein